ncbi:hypothetical protein LAV79_19285 [Peribacillus butanolivorans]|uniref:hypothetical protein n=1 Tax=Peribacillus butanolivorans TaxID=421767 RepID=UPI0030C9A073
MEALGEDAPPIIGYSINAVIAGEVVSYVRNVKGGGEGVPGPQGSKRQGCWEETVKRNSSESRDTRRIKSWNTPCYIFI